MAATLFAAATITPAYAHPPKDHAKSEQKSDPQDDSSKLPPLPADKSVDQTTVIAGKSLHYKATVGKLPVRNSDGKIIAEVVYTAYTVPGASPSRPVTFAFNGGPGASSVYLNLGAIGPKRVRFGDAGDSPSDAPVLSDNPHSWLDFTDLVFIDPVGTGYSRSLEDKDKTKKDFYANDPDIKYLSRIVYDWLVQNQRLRSPKYVIGESYGGYRAPRIAYELQTQMGVGVSGLVMVSPYLDPASVSGDNGLSPLPWMINLPSMAAAKLEREGKLTAANMAPIENYTQTQFVTDFFAGPKDKVATDRLVNKVAELTGLDHALVAKLNGRIDIGTFLREGHRAQKKIGSVYDSNVTAFDPFPGSAERKSNDPILNAILAPTTSAMVDFITRTVGWDVKGRHYEALSYAVNEAWDRGTPDDKPVEDLRKAIANDPKMQVIIAHGWNDLSCPFFGSKLLIEQMPGYGVADRIHLDIFPGGHMFYTRDDSGAAFRNDAKAIYTR
ncbi:S10 family peptidase [Stakelama sediminis]|uniref:Carboxypeptidase C (Cathepsin A) n=1 Tax=Stakelama sediminis TaxID=463200 RepID=A0A840YX08_9SPHN|nr:peptidase S10 [Stakelama sediminis]MBB5718087.1 carboxypeptidase C (cathepsin A) [Stakelama sediminis]